MSQLTPADASVHPTLKEIAQVVEAAGMPHEFTAVPDGSFILFVGGVFEDQGLAVFSVDGSHLRVEIPDVGVSVLGENRGPIVGLYLRHRLCEIVSLLDFRLSGMARLGVDTDGELRAIVVLPLDLPAADLVTTALAELRAAMAALAEIQALSSPAVANDEHEDRLTRSPFGPTPTSRLLS